MPACFATLLRPGTGALWRSGKNCRYQNHFAMDDRDKWWSRPVLTLKNVIFIFTNKILQEFFHVWDGGFSVSSVILFMDFFADRNQ